MIKLELPGPKPGARDLTWIRWRNECEVAKQDLIQSREQGVGVAVELDPRLYRRRSIFKRYYHDAKATKRSAPFYGKCVYCEVPKTILYIEHFRPKKAVADAWKRSLPDGTLEKHPGYYWLAYEIGNLLVACDDCNSKVYKGSKFPLVDERARAWTSMDDLTKEAPLLLNPFVDDPSQHIGLDPRHRKLTHKTDRGRLTIELLGLNRDPLPDWRGDTAMRIRESWVRWRAIESTKEERTQAFEHLQRSIDGCFPFTLTARVQLAQLFRSADSTTPRITV